MNKLLLLMLLAGTLCSAQQTLTVVDSLTNEPVPYVAVNLLNGYGVFSDDKGVVTVTDTLVKQIELSCLGYETKKVAVNAGKVSLKPEPLLLEEIIIKPLNKARQKLKEVKPRGHQDSSYLYMSATGLQYAFLVEAKEPESYLTGIALPLMEIAFEAEGTPGVFKPVLFNTLVKIELLQNSNGIPGKTIANFEQVEIITNTASLKRFDVVLSEEIPLPAEGLFVQLTILGRSDTHGALSSKPGYTAYTDVNGKPKLFALHCQPNFPLVERPKGVLTFIKEPFIDNVWKPINEPSLHAIKKYPDMNIPFGYTFKTYK